MPIQHTKREDNKRGYASQGIYPLPQPTPILFYLDAVYNSNPPIK